jgi:cobalt-zinc-cadmium efflux system protein
MMESAPSHIDPETVKSALLGIEGVAGIHDLHVWTISSGWVSLSAHVEKRPEADAAKLLAEAKTLLHDRFGIEHLTLQIEPPGGECSTASCGEEIPH